MTTPTKKHTAERIAKMLATRKRNKAAKLRTMKNGTDFPLHAIPAKEVLPKYPSVKRTDYANEVAHELLLLAARLLRGK